MTCGFRCHFCYIDCCVTAVGYIVVASVTGCLSMLLCICVQLHVVIFKIMLMVFVHYSFGIWLLWKWCSCLLFVFVCSVWCKTPDFRWIGKYYGLVVPFCGWWLYRLCLVLFHLLVCKCFGHACCHWFCSCVVVVVVVHFVVVVIYRLLAEYLRTKEIFELFRTSKKRG